MTFVRLSHLLCMCIPTCGAVAVVVNFVDVEYLARKFGTHCRLKGKEKTTTNTQISYAWFNNTS